MAVRSEKIIGSKIINEVDSSNLSRTEYDIDTKKLIAEFKNGQVYEYDDVPHKIYTQFRMSESQGKFFSANIARAYKYKKK